MARMARVVAPGVPHHVTQRGNARQTVFEDPEDRRIYLNLLREYSTEHHLQIWAWCLMTNHIHLLAVPKTSLALARAIGAAHRDYARYRNARSCRCGHFWQARYYSCPVDASGVWPVMAYIERNPVRAGLVPHAEDYPWSSAAVHVRGWDDSGFIDLAAWREQYTCERWQEALQLGVDEEALQERIRRATRTGRPLGSDGFTHELEHVAGRRLRPGQRGRPRRSVLETGRQAVLALQQNGE